MDPVNVELLQQMQEVRGQRRAFENLLHFVAELQLERQTQLRVETGGWGGACSPFGIPDSPCLVHACHTLTGPWDGCCWGRQVARHVWQWLCKLQWPSDIDGVGITWLELFVSFCLDQQVLIGVIQTVQYASIDPR